MMARVTMVTAMTTVSNTSTLRRPIEYVSLIQPGSGNVLTRAPTYIRNTAVTRKWMPKEVSNCVKSDEPRTLLKAIRSDEQRGADRHHHDERGHQIPGPAAVEGGVGGVPAHGDQLAVSEVEQVHHSEDHGHPQRQQRVDAAAAQAVDHVLRELGHWALPRTNVSNRSVWARTSAPEPWATTDPLRST